MFLVTWLPDAMDQLVSVYTTSDLERQRAIAPAVERVNLRLARDGPTAGESREGNRRVLIIDPVTVSFYVDPAAREVVVTYVRVR